MYESIAITHCGFVRTNNEDNFYQCGNYKKDINLNDMTITDYEEHSSCLYAVFDGMGGYEHGEQASLIAAEVLRDYADGFGGKVQEYIEAANAAICSFREQNSSKSGSTYAGLYICDDIAYISNLGDSKVFLFREGKLEQLSEDHTEIQFMLRNGLIDASQVRGRKESHILTQNLGVFRDDMIVEAYMALALPVENGDVFLLCSDGLTDMLDNGEIEDIIGINEDINEAAGKLLDAALKKGGKDNITLILVKQNKVINAKKGATKMNNQSSSAVEKQKSNKPFIIIASIVIAALIAIAAVLAIRGGTRSSLMTKLLQGHKYLDELDYEQALACFLAAIEIDEKNAEAYLGAAEAYIGLGEYKSALAILKKAERNASSDELLEKIELIRAETKTEKEDEDKSEEKKDDELQDESDGDVDVITHEVRGIDLMEYWPDYEEAAYINGIINTNEYYDQLSEENIKVIEGDNFSIRVGPKDWGGYSVSEDNTVFFSNTGNTDVSVYGVQIGDSLEEAKSKILNNSYIGYGFYKEEFEEIVVISYLVVNEKSGEGILELVFDESEVVTSWEFTNSTHVFEYVFTPYMVLYQNGLNNSDLEIQQFNAIFDAIDEVNNNPGLSDTLSERIEQIIME